MPKHSPGAFQNLAQRVPDPSKIEAWGVPGNQNEPKKSARPTKSAQETPQEPPRGSPKRPGAPQERPRAVQEAHGRRPNFSKIDPGALQDPPKIHLKSRFQKTCDFSSIFALKTLCCKSADVDFVLVFPILFACRALFFKSLFACIFAQTNSSKTLQNDV